MEDAGCMNETILKHCRRSINCSFCYNTGQRLDTDAFVANMIDCDKCLEGACGPHVRGCWVIDLITKENKQILV